jgi:serine/threonine protein kinase/tetratricopeptide (TPR) repeat protein
MSQEFQRDYLIRLPLPLAQLYQRAYNDKSAQSRHNNTFYLFEALIKLAASPAIAAYLHEVEHGAPRVAELDRLLAQLALPSLGQWVGMLRALANYFGTRPDAAAHPLGHLWHQLNQPYRDRPGLLALYRRIKNGLDGAPAGDQSCSPMQVIDALVPYRNAVFGHGAGRFESFYEREMGPLLFPAANELLAEGMLDVLGPHGSRLVHIAELRMLDEDRVEVGLRELVGERSARTAPVILGRAQAEALVPDRVAVLWPGRPVPLRLDPLLLYREREMGDEVLFLNRDRNGRQVEYLSYTRGEPERDRTTAPALAALLARVTGRDIDPDQLEVLAQQSVAGTSSVEALFGPAPVAAKALGDYEILAEIGRGGMGVVYLARQLSLGRLVALKMLPADLAGDEVALARFRREMRLLARCDHLNIVKVLASGTLPDGRVYYAMEYVPGCDLEQVWREISGSEVQGAASTLGGSTWARAVLSASRKKRQQMTPRPAASSGDGHVEEPLPALPLPPLPELPSAEDDPGGYARRVAMLVRDAALALQAIHDQQMVHRDVKPANLMLTPDGSRVVLMDFGLAKGQSLSLSASRAGGLLGTLRYAAPEQLAAASLKVGPTADVRGLGVTLWEVLTRRRLFAEAENERQLAAMVYDRDVPRLRTIDPSIDRDLEAIVVQATERRATDRIATAGALAADLSRWLRGEPVQAQPPTLGYLLRKSIGRHRVGVALVSSLVLAALLGSASILTTTAMFRIDRARVAAEKARKDAVKAEHKAESARAIAERAKGAAVIAFKDAQKARASEAEARKALHLRVVQNVDVANGFRRIEEGDLLGSLVWFADALQLEQGDPKREQVHRDRLAATLRFCPKLSQVFFHDGLVRSASFSPDGRRVVTASLDKTARVWDAGTGQPITPPLKHGGEVNAAAFSPDGRRVVTASSDETARVWDAESGRPITPPIKHDGLVRHSAFSPDGRCVVTASYDKTARVWDTPLSDERESEDWIRLAQMLSGTRIDQGGGLLSITSAEFRESWRALRDKYPDDFVASPREVLAWHYREADDCEAHGLWEVALGHLDRLIASEPAQWWLYARRAWVYKRLLRWEESLADFMQAIARDPRDWTSRIGRGDACAELGRWDQAAADFAKIVAEGAEDSSVDARIRLAYVRLAMADYAAYRQACADLLAHLGPQASPGSAESVAWTCVLAPDAVADRQAVMRLAEQAPNGADNDSERHVYLQTLAAATYRAGRFEEAVKHLDAGIRTHGKGGNPLDWLLLALAHQRLGHAGEARTWLDKAARWLDASTQDKPADDAFGPRIDWQIWLALRVLRREAESTLKAGKAGPSSFEAERAESRSQSPEARQPS